MAYIDAGALRAYLGIEAQTDDALLTAFAGAAQAHIESACNRRFEAVADETRSFEAADANGPLLYLDADLCALTGVDIDGEAADVSAVRTVPLNSAPWWALRRPGGWHGEIEVTGRWAYSVAPPADIRQACIRLAAFMYRQKDSNSDADRPQQTPEGTWLMPMKLPADISVLIAPYRRIAT